MHKLLLFLVVFLLVSCASGTSTSGQSGSNSLTCRKEHDSTRTTNAFTGIGINYTSNVQVRLENGAHVTVQPTSSQSGTTDSGIRFTSLTFSEIPASFYTVIILANGQQIDTYQMSVRVYELHTLTIFCS